MTGILPCTEHERLLGLLRRHGWNATSFQVLEPGLRHLWLDDDACVAYFDTGRAWVAAGAPLTAPGRLGEAARAFVDAASRAHRRACFFAVEERFVSESGLRSLRIGEQAVWDPRSWPVVLSSSRSLREQIRRARAKGLQVRMAEATEIADERSPLRSALETIATRWLRTRELAPMGFLVRVAPLTFLSEHRLYLAEQKGVPVAFLQVAPVYGRAGWLLQNLLRLPEAPNGVSEMLIDFAMRDAAAEGRQYVTLGLAPLSGEVPRALRVARTVGSAVFNFAGLRAFRAKLMPADWVPQFLCYPANQGVVSSIKDALAAFAHGSLMRFTLQTLLRGPTVLVRLLAFLLAPWSLILAASDDRRWFPRPWMKWAWVVFDVLMIVALTSLARKWREGRATILVVAIGADALVTALQAAGWNVPRGLSSCEAAVVGVAVAAPALAFLTLFRARTRRKSASGKGTFHRS